MAEVKTKLTLVDNVSKRLTKIETALNKLSKEFVNSATKSDRLDRTLQGVGSTSKSAAKNLDKTSNSIDNMDKKMRKASSSSSLLTTKLKQLASVYLGVMGTRALITTSDTLTSAENRLSTLGMNSGMSETASKQLSQSTLDKIYAASQDSNMGYLDMAANVSKAVTLADNSFGDNIEDQMNNAIRFQNVMAKTYALGGASAAEQASSMYQLVQSLGAGKLQGDELRSLTEGAPLAAKAIEKFAQKVYGTELSLKDMGSQGMLSSDLVVAAILDMGGTVDNQFGKLDKTFAQLWTNFKNDAIKAFEPFIRKMREISNSDDFAFLIEKATNALWEFANGATQALNYVEIALSWIRNNWETFEAILTIGAATLTFKIGTELYGAFHKLTTTVIDFLTNASKVARMFGAIAVIITIIYVGFNALKDAAKSLTDQLGILAIMVALIVGTLMLFGVIAFSIPILIAASIVLLIGLILKFTEQVFGAFMWLLAAIANLFIGGINAAINFLWTHFVQPILSVVEYIYNLFNGGFDGIGGAFSNLLGQMVGWLLDFAKAATKILDAVFGTDWTSKLDELADTARSWGKTDDAATFASTINAPTIERFNLTDAYNTGAAAGASFKGWMNNTLGEGINLSGILDTDALTDKISGNYDFNDANNSLANIDLNTSNMANSMELSEEDLKYLRLLAEQEAINKFTTAEIKIDMTNNNNVSKGADLDGVVTYLTETLRTELVTMANGVTR